MVRFAEKVETEEIKRRIEELLKDPAIREIDGLLAELRFRKKRFQFKIFDEMVRL